MIDPPLLPERHVVLRLGRGAGVVEGGLEPFLRDFAPRLQKAVIQDGDAADGKPEQQQRPEQRQGRDAGGVGGFEFGIFGEAARREEDREHRRDRQRQVQKEGELIEHEPQHGRHARVLLDEVACPDGQGVDRQEQAKGGDAEQVEREGLAQEVA